MLQGIIAAGVLAGSLAGAEPAAGSNLSVLRAGSASWTGAFRLWVWSDEVRLIGTMTARGEESHAAEVLIELSLATDRLRVTEAGTERRVSWPDGPTMKFVVTEEGERSYQWTGPGGGSFTVEIAPAQAAWVTDGMLASVHRALFAKPGAFACGVTLSECWAGALGLNESGRVGAVSYRLDLRAEACGCSMTAALD
ncbi:MAG: hypothetical protein LAT64_04850 [Phycisphaerales bacterium]|nr:hypothetical protein [Planctomycetota bacterium]MCH8508083.1 hypothetical protein [Phycisphaerales bacterium]